MKIAILTCPACSAEYRSWVGQCARCGHWFEEHHQRANIATTLPKTIREIQTQEAERFYTDWPQIDQVTGGGIVKDSLTLIAGSPGVGKSTLLLQIAHTYARKKKRVLYISAEESIDQVKLRAKRLGIDQDHIFLSAEDRLSAISEHIEHVKPQLLVLDSAQLIYDDRIKAVPGGPTQVKNVAQECMIYAKQRKITTMLIGHITKDGDIAGPRALEHLVDTVLEFEGDQKLGIRLLRCNKNRFGPTDEVSLFEMKEQGLLSISDPSQFFLENFNHQLYGVAIAPTLEGRRAFLVESQVLTTKSTFPNPTRRFTCLDPNRVHMLIAVLDKRHTYALHSYDVYASLIGGVKIVEPAIDLSLLLAIASSFRGIPIIPFCVSIGEVGLSGEIRPVTRCQVRVDEAIRMGMKRILLPKKNFQELTDESKSKAHFYPLEDVSQALDLAIKS